VGDKIRTKKEYRAENVGIMGDYASGNTLYVQQMRTEGELDLEALAKDLERLRSEMASKASEPAQYTALGAVTAAEVAAKQGDGAKALAQLRTAGGWAFDVATKIGVNIASSVLKGAIGSAE
jgi:hypothetical protein